MRIAIAGDFLPASTLALPPGPTPCRDAAAPLAPLFEDAAAVFVNLECTLDTPACILARCRDLAISFPPLLQRSTTSMPSAATIVDVANNHSYDFRASGAARTRQALAARGMTPLGAGQALRTPPEVLLWRGPHGIRVGFWAAALGCTDLATRKSTGVEPATVSRAQPRVSEDWRFSLASCSRRLFSIRAPDAEPHRSSRPSQFCVTGLLDDLFGLSPYMGLGAQFAAACVVWLAGWRFPLFSAHALNFAAAAFSARAVPLAIRHLRLRASPA
jgi:hypothetical protein